MEAQDWCYYILRINNETKQHIMMMNQILWTSNLTTTVVALTEEECAEVKQLECTTFR